MQHSVTSRFVLSLSICFLVTPQLGTAQTFSIIHNFTGGADGAQPIAGITRDVAGNLYGATNLGGGLGYGAVYELTHNRANWLFDSLHSFSGWTDGENAIFRVGIGSGGVVYGSTYYGGNGCQYYGGCGTIFRLQPPVSVCTTISCPWPENVLYRFQGPPSDGDGPYSDITFDQNHNIYGTTLFGGSTAIEAVLTPVASGRLLRQK